MAKTTADQLKKIIKKISKRYVVDENTNGYSVWLGGEYKELKLIVNEDDDNLTVRLLGESCTTKAPFDIIKDIVTTRWGTCTYSRGVAWDYNDDRENLGEGDRDSRVVLNEIKGFTEGIPRYFEDKNGSLDVETCDKIEGYVTGERRFKYEVTFLCEPSKEQLAHINKQFDDNVMEEVREFFNTRGIDVTVKADDAFIKD